MAVVELVVEEAEMSDLVERLRQPTVNAERVLYPRERDLVDTERREAADEIERLRLLDSGNMQYYIRLQRLIEAFCRDDDELPYPELHHSQKLVAKCKEIERLRGLLREARDNIDCHYGPSGTNRIDAPLLSRIDAAMKAPQP